jgi:stage II sporulation protein GA (sporulation sigma-E factor processing peptidase)
VMKVFRIEKMCIHMDEDIWIENPLLGMSERTLSEKERYEMILNPGIFL